MNNLFIYFAEKRKMIEVSNKTSTADLKAIKENDEITDGFNRSGKVVHKSTQHRTGYVLYIFTLDSGEKIIIDKR